MFPKTDDMLKKAFDIFRKCEMNLNTSRAMKHLIDNDVKKNNANHIVSHISKTLRFILNVKY